MRNITVFGAGKSSNFLFDYLLKNTAEQNWQITIADREVAFVKNLVKDNAAFSTKKINILDEDERQKLVSKSQVVISLLPAALHDLVAKDCLKFKVNLITASYISPFINEIASSVKDAGILFLGEMGLDPGIDHMSAMKMMDKAKNEGAIIESFKSYCGGLIMPENSNPWKYKFTWNPRNVVLAGQSTAQYLNNGKYKFIPAQRVFEDIEKLKIPDIGNFDAYINRDSLKYVKAYGLENAQTVLRGTLRHKGFCEKWNVLVRLGITDDSFVIENSSKLTYKDFIKSFLPDGVNLEKFIWDNFEIDKNDKSFKAIDWLGLMSDEKIDSDNLTPAEITQKLLEKKWMLELDDKDLVVMYHEISYKIKDKNYLSQMAMQLVGEDTHKTAMAKTVGLPLGIAAKNILNGNITLKGVHIPIVKEIYEPVLAELETNGIKFIETTKSHKKSSKEENSFKFFSF